MKTYKKFILCLIFGAFLAFFGDVYAATPTLFLSPSGTDNVIVNVNGDYNSSVILYYNSTFILQNRVIGNTNNNGFFSATISSSSFGITPGSLVYVTVNNQQSVSMIWPFSSSSSSALSLSQNNLSLSVGQTSVVTVLNNYNNYGTLYISSNSNPTVATASIINNTVSIYGSNIGSSVVTICQSGNMASSCGTIYVNVVAGGYAGGYGYNPTSTLNTFGLNISNLTLANRSSITISSADPGGMYISNNTNPKVVSTSYSSSLASGCTAGALYSVTTGLPCSSIYNGGSQFSSLVPGCTAGALFSVLTGQSCLGYNNQTNTNNNTSVIISALAVGSDMITLCQNNGNACSNIYVSVIY